MKGYANIEFMIAGMAYLSLVLYLLYIVNYNMNYQFNEANNFVRRSMTYRFIANMVFDKGSPKNWNNPLTANKIGLAEKPWVLNATKVRLFMQACDNDYITLQSKIGRPFFLKITDSSGNILYACPRASKGGLISIPVVFNGTMALMEAGIE